MSEFKLGRMTLRSLFGKPATKAYPIEAPTYYPETKGHVTIDVDKCRFDGACANLCPTGAIEVDRKEYTWSIDRFKCIQCRTCVHVCVENVLAMDNQYAAPSTAHTRDIYTVSPEERVVREAEAAEKAAKAARLREEALAKKKAAAEKAAADSQASDGDAEPKAPKARKAKASEATAEPEA